jgi:hypothetical protein
MAYSRGVFTPDQDCLPRGEGGKEGGLSQQVCGREVDHAMVLVGYGREEGGQEFWVLKNTWGTTWGEGGYMRMAREGGKEGGGCGTSCVGAFAMAAVQGWSLVPMEEWEEEEGGEGGKEGEGVIDTVQEVVERIGDALIGVGDAINESAKRTAETIKGWDREIQKVDKRVLALGLFVGSALLVGFLYYCCWVRRRRRARLVALQLERERARWV